MNQNRIDYVVGFMFEHGERHVVALIEKKRPKWQAGYLNGIGGKIEPNETPQVAMAREFHEEAGWQTDPETWKSMVVLDGIGVRVTFLMNAMTDVKYRCKTQTDEEVVVVPYNNLRIYKTVPNLQWIIPFCLNATKTLDGFRPAIPLLVQEVASQ